MKTKVDLEILEEQIQYLDNLASIVANEHTRELIDGIINLLDRIRWAVEEDDELRFERVN